jgi:hypothetical protein
MYADDLVLLSSSLTELQTMIDVCCRELSLLDIKINPSKSNAIRIGKRFKEKCSDLHAGNEIIAWVNEAKYLGGCIVSGQNFKCNFEKAKRKYYRAANGILAKLENKDNVSVTLNLLSSVALPVLTYSIEALSLNNAELISINHPWERSFQKLFRTFDSQIVKLCQWHTGYLPIKYYYCLRSIALLKGLAQSPSVLLRSIYEIAGQEDIRRLANLMNCDSQNFIKHYGKIVHADFASKLL